MNLYYGHKCRRSFFNTKGFTVGSDEYGMGGTTLSISRNVLTSQSIYYSNNNNYQIITSPNVFFPLAKVL